MRTPSAMMQSRNRFLIKDSVGRKMRAKINKSFANMSRPTSFKYLGAIPKYSEERDFSGTSKVPVYVMLPPGIINMECELVDPDDKLLSQLKTLKSVNVDGVSVDIWWGIVEADNSTQYKWEGYKQLFQIVCEAGLNIRVAMSFHEFRRDDVKIPLPKWIKEIGKENPDIYFRDRHGNPNPECLNWGIDEEPVLKGRTAVEVYYDFMSSFRAQFDKFFHVDREIFTDIQIGLGASGELCYPSFPANHGSEYSGIGASKRLVHHADKVLSMAKEVFDDPYFLSVKLSSIHWWAKPGSQAEAERRAGFGDDHLSLLYLLEEYFASINFTCADLSTLGLQEIFDPHMFVSEILNDAWSCGVRVAGENVTPCYDREGYNKILELAKPRQLRYKCRRLAAFTYNMLNEALLIGDNLKEFQHFVKRMHGEAAAAEDWIEI